MFKLKAPDGTNNLIGRNLRRLRLAHNPPYSQRRLALRLQVMGYDVDNHFIRRIENGQRFVTDIELILLARALDTTIAALLDGFDTDPSPGSITRI